MNVINGYEPKAVFKYFEDICAIPHGSGNEERIADYICEFAKEHKLEYYRDKNNNCFVTLPASKGYENKPSILLQGHTDMVCEKNSDCIHDFLNDGLKLAVENDYLYAEGTTLGGDDGIAVAIMLAVLSGEIKEHPMIECLFTTEEETGLCGASSFDYSRIKSKRMINLDSEDESTVTVGCSGGIRSDIIISSELTENNDTVTGLKIKISGLCGGHSGAEINCGRANANKLMGRMLARLREVCFFLIAKLDGGSKDNAIPRECETVIVLNENSVYDAVVALDALYNDIAKELSDDDNGFCITFDRVPAVPSFDKQTTDAVIALLSSVQNGVRSMCRDIPSLVEFSRNLGVIKTVDEKIKFTFSARSALDSQLDESVRELDALANALNWLVMTETSHHSRYPGWNYSKDSPTKDTYLKAYKQVFGKDAKVDIIHAGLECGIIGSYLPDLDMISVGPNMIGIHSPSEKLDLRSCERLWKVLKLIIEG